MRRRFSFARIRKLLRLPPQRPAPPNIHWAQEFYFAPLDEVVSDSMAAPADTLIEEVESAAYYETIGYDGRGLRVPSDLDSSLCAYMRLPPDRWEVFHRAMWWMSAASRFGYRYMSASFIALVSAIESLTEQGISHRVFCPECNELTQHHSPGVTESFRRFLETYAPAASLRRRRTEIYELRSNLVHGGTLMELDEGRGGGWDPPWERERRLHDELSGLTRLALRNWLNTP